MNLHEEVWEGVRTGYVRRRCEDEMREGSVRRSKKERTKRCEEFEKSRWKCKEVTGNDWGGEWGGDEEFREKAEEEVRKRCDECEEEVRNRCGTGRCEEELRGGDVGRTWYESEDELRKGEKLMRRSESEMYAAWRVDVMKMEEGGGEEVPMRWIWGEYMRRRCEEKMRGVREEEGGSARRR
jgi:hypothetical protein